MSNNAKVSRGETSEVKEHQQEHPLPSLIVPFSLKMEVVDRMLNFEITDDPIYSGLEIQGFEDDEHGHGMLVFLQRHEGEKTDVYFERGLKLNPKLYAVGGGLGVWTEHTFQTIRLDISESEGIDAEVKFVDVDGRNIEVRVGDKTPLSKREMAKGFLAPMGAAIHNPRSLPLVYMRQFDLLRRTGDEPVILIDGHSVSTGRLPAETMLGRRLIKVAKDLCMVSLNPSDINQEETEAGRAMPVHEPGTVKRGDNHVVEAITADLHGHTSKLVFDPPFPYLMSLAGSDSVGTWSIDVDETSSIVAGRWKTRRWEENSVEIVVDVTTGWRPQGLPLLMKDVTTVVPVFRHWPKTYRWVAIVSLHNPSSAMTTQSLPTMKSRWERTSSDRGESYRVMSGASKNQ
jgi:hypothetical protein